jgi:polar amino acid transport system substrate-binding protein
MSLGLLQKERLMKQISLFLLIMLAGFTSVSAQDTLVVGITESYMPWEQSQGGVASGINIDIVNAIAKKLGVTVKFEVYPFKRNLAMLEAGKIDMVCGLSYREERAVYASYITPAYIPTIKSFIMKKGSTKVLNDYNDLYPLKIGLRRGAKQFEPFDSDTKLNKFEVPTSDQLLQMLLKDHIDVIVGSYINLLYDAKTLGYADNIIIAKYNIDQGMDGQFVLSKKSKFISRKAEIETILNDMSKSGQIVEMIDSYTKK